MPAEPRVLRRTPGKMCQLLAGPAYACETVREAIAL